MSWFWKLLGKKWLWFLAGLVVFALYVVGIISDLNQAEFGFMFFWAGFVIIWVYKMGREAEKKPKVKLYSSMPWDDFLAKVQGYGFTHLKEIKIGPDEGYRVMAHRRKKLVLVAEGHREFDKLVLGDLRVYGTARAKNINFKTVGKLFNVHADKTRVYGLGAPPLNYLDFCCVTPEKLFSALYGVGLSMEFVRWTDPYREVIVGEETEKPEVNLERWESILTKGPAWLRNFVLHERTS